MSTAAALTTTPFSTGGSPAAGHLAALKRLVMAGWPTRSSAWSQLERWRAIVKEQWAMGTTTIDVINLNDHYTAGLLRRAQEQNERDLSSCVVRSALVDWRITTAASDRL
jgi:hypothetical protein